MSGTKSRNKGHGFERDMVKLWRKYFPQHPIRRGLGQTRIGNEVCDVEGHPQFWIECKRHKQVGIRAALRQAVRDTDSRMPLAICKDDRQEAIIVMRLNDFMEVIYEKQAQGIPKSEKIDEGGEG
jgi:hypothetical protein